jgi:hypothetical protein
MSKPYYVTLTGSRNNAGDFLIRHRAHNLLAALRPDRKIVDRNAWEPFSEERLEEVNGAQALMLLGGPALRKNMYPSVYPLLPDLDRIKVPITIMGAGWHALPGTWEDSRNYKFTGPTQQLLERVASDGAGLSVRDYRSLNALDRAGISGGMMTGCPALYVPEMIGEDFTGFPVGGVKNLVFSLGVNFIGSAALERQAKHLITGLRSAFSAAKLTVAFHHSIDFQSLKASYGAGQDLSARRHQQIVQWLEAEDIAYTDISGGVDKLLALYEAADFHVGYRVHAHIFMCSHRKPSVLITEDGRGRGLKDVLGGVIFDSWVPRNLTVKERLLAKVGQPVRERRTAFTGIEQDVADIVAYEQQYGLPRFAQPAGRIDLQYRVMQQYIQELP